MVLGKLLEIHFHVRNDDRSQDIVDVALSIEIPFSEHKKYSVSISNLCSHHPNAFTPVAELKDALPYAFLHSMSTHDSAHFQPTNCVFLCGEQSVR